MTWPPKPVPQPMRVLAGEPGLRSGLAGNSGGEPELDYLAAMALTACFRGINAVSPPWSRPRIRTLRRGAPWRRIESPRDRYLECEQGLQACRGLRRAGWAR